MHTLTASSTTTAQPRAARRYGLILFFVAAYAWTWLFQLLSVLIARHTISLPLPRELVETIGFLGPALAALAVTAYEAGGAGVRALLAQQLRWRVRPSWYAVALGGPLLLTLALAVLYRATGGVLPSSVPLQMPLPLLLLLFFVYVGLFHGGLDEELGWRGYALPRLQARYGALTASLILGCSGPAGTCRRGFFPILLRPVCHSSLASLASSPKIASQSEPHKRSKIDVCSRKCWRCAGWARMTSSTR